MRETMIPPMFDQTAWNRMRPPRIRLGAISIIYTWQVILGFSYILSMTYCRIPIPAPLHSFASAQVEGDLAVLRKMQPLKRLVGLHSDEMAYDYEPDPSKIE
jgi:hypothetical protein